METGQIIAIVITILVTIVAEYLFVKNMNLSFRLVNYFMIFLILAVPVTTVSLFVALNIKLPPTKTKCPNDCSGNGTCDPLTGKCSCNAGYFGNDCSKQVPPDCGGKGTYDAATKTCTCTAPFSGPDCSVNCSTVTCNKEGTCNPEDGTCTCTGKNFTGANCDVCKGNFALPNCDTCKGNFTGVNCDVCKGNFTGTNCDTCKGNFALPDCSTKCVGNFALPDCAKCTGNFALPDCTTCTGQFALPDCTKCNPNYYGSGCDTFCDAATTCNGNGTCDPKTGLCVCDPKGNFSSATCLGTPAGSINGGGGNCKAGWEGAKCDQKVCPWDNNKECSGNGNCGADGTCSCKFGWVGESCSTDLTFLIIIGIIFGVGLVAYLIWWFFNPSPSKFIETAAGTRELPKKTEYKPYGGVEVKEGKIDFPDAYIIPEPGPSREKKYGSAYEEPLSATYKRQFEADSKILGEEEAKTLLRSIPGTANKAYTQVHEAALMKEKQAKEKQKVLTDVLKARERDPANIEKRIKYGQNVAPQSSGGCSIM